MWLEDFRKNSQLIFANVCGHKFYITYIHYICNRKVKSEVKWLSYSVVSSVVSSVVILLVTCPSLSTTQL